MTENTEFYNMTDYAKELYIEQNIWDLDENVLRELINLKNFHDDRVYSRLKYKIISNMDYITEKKIDILHSIFGIDLSGIKTLIKEMDINVSDIMNLTYDRENQLYDEKVNSLYTILTKLENIEDAKKAIELYNSLRERKFFRKFEDEFESLSDLYRVRKIENDFYDKKFSEAEDLVNKKNVLLYKFFNVGLYEMEELLKKIHENGFESNFKNYDLFLNIITSENPSDIENLYLTFEKDYTLYEEMLTDYKIYCMNDIVNEVNSIEIPKESKKINDVLVYDFSNIEFNLLIHRTNAVSNNYFINPVLFAEYNNVDGKNTISCSGISNMFLGRVEYEDDSVYFGFSNIEDTDILDMGPENINMTDEINSHTPSSISGENFMKFSKLMECTFDQYNEIALFRFDQYTGEPIKPTYIVCFDEIDEYSLNVAKKMKLPIFFIDTKVVYKNAKNKINEMIEDDLYYTSDEKNVELANKILSFAYGAYCSGRNELDENALERFLQKTSACRAIK